MGRRGRNREKKKKVVENHKLEWGKGKTREEIEY